MPYLNPEDLTLYVQEPNTTRKHAIKVTILFICLTELGRLF